MADLSKVTLPDGNTYNIKDAVARDSLRSVSAAVVSAVVFKGVSSAALADGGTQHPVVNNVTTTAKSIGDLYFYGINEYIWGADSKWHLLGSENGTLGRLAYASSARGSVNYTPAGGVSQPTFSGAELSSSGSYTPAGGVSQPTFSGAELSSTASYTPAGTVSQPTFSGAALTSTAAYTPVGSVGTPTISVNSAGTTTTIKNPTSVTVAKTVTAGTASSNQIAYYSISGDTLTLQPIGYTTGASITTNDVTVKTGDASYKSSQPSFTGTAATISAKGTPSGTVSKPTFSGTGATIIAKGTPAGTVSKPTFSGTAATITVKGTPAGTVSKPSFTGTQATITVTSTALTS